MRLCVRAIIERKDQILVYRKRDQFRLFGGTVKRKETLHQALSREIYEETGLTGTIGDLFSVVKNPGTTDFIFRFQTDTPFGRFREFDALWIPSDQLTLVTIGTKTLFTNSTGAAKSAEKYAPAHGHRVSS